VGKAQPGNDPRIPPVVLIMKKVDGGAAVIGVLECPHCGQDHYTTRVNAGNLDVFCGRNNGATRPDGWSTVCVERVI
jgi:hypothetical protein